MHIWFIHINNTFWDGETEFQWIKKGKKETDFISPFNRRKMFTCTKLISGHIEGLHLHLEGVDGYILGHTESLLLTAHVRVAQGSPQVVQASVTGRDSFCHREGNRID